MTQLIGILGNGKINRNKEINNKLYSDNDLLVSQNTQNKNVSENNSIIIFENEKYLLIVNGIIYNIRDLRDRELISEGCNKNDISPDLLLKLYEKEGKDFIKELSGMFSLIIWDKVKKVLYGARDIFGTRHLYYRETPNGLYFSFDFKSLYEIIKDDDCNDINNISLQNYMTYQYVPGPNTIINGIDELMPGSSMVKTLGEEIIIERHRTLRLNPIKGIQDQKSRDIREAIIKSVESNMESNRNVGCFLSGGVDSAIITGLAKDINPNIKSFTAGFDVAGYSEIDLAKEIAQEYGIENINRTISPEEFTEELANIIYHMGVPLADPAAIPLYFIAKEAKKHVGIVLSGEGADELFGGYNIYKEPIALKLLSRMPDKFKTSLLYLSRLIPEGVKGKSFITRACIPLEKRYVGNACIFQEEEKILYLKNYDGNYRFDLVTKPYYESLGNGKNIEKMQYIDINTWLVGDILMKAYRMSGAHTLELRSPFLDKGVFEVASKLSPKDKIKGKTTKHLLRQAFAELIPENMINRKKLGFPVPIRVWLKDEIYDWAVDIIKTSNTDKHINKTEVLKLLEEHQKGNRDNSRKIWTMLTFMIWHDIFIDKESSHLTIEGF